MSLRDGAIHVKEPKDVTAGSFFLGEAIYAFFVFFCGKINTPRSTDTTLTAC